MTADLESAYPQAGYVHVAVAAGPSVTSRAKGGMHGRHAQEVVSCPQQTLCLPRGGMMGQPLQHDVRCAPWQAVCLPLGAMIGRAQDQTLRAKTVRRPKPAQVSCRPLDQTTGRAQQQAAGHPLAQRLR